MEVGLAGQGLDGRLDQLRDVYELQGGIPRPTWGREPAQVRTDAS